MGKGGLSDNLDSRSNYNLQVAGRAPKKSPEWLKAEGVRGEKDRPVYYLAMQSGTRLQFILREQNSNADYTTVWHQVQRKISLFQVFFQI